MDTFQFIHANIIDVIHGNVFEDKVILVENGKIKKITNQPKSCIKTIDLDYKYVMPGLINLHVHLFGSGKPSKTLTGGKKQERLLKIIRTKFGQKVVKKIVANCLKQNLYSGCTTIRSVGDFQYADIYCRDLIQKNKIIGPRLLTSGYALTVPHGHGDGTISITATNEEDFKKLVQQNIRHHVDWIKICITGGVMDAKKRGEPGELKMPLEMVKAVCEEAHQNHLKVAAHCESVEGVKVALLGGVDTIEHGAILDKQMINLFKENQKALITTLSPAVPMAYLPPSVTGLSEDMVFNGKIVCDGIIQASKQALANDIILGLGTDASCPYAAQTNMYRELCYFQKYVGVDNKTALRYGTIENAKILGLDAHIGSIEEGKIADMIVTSKSPLEDLKNLSQIQIVVKEGKVYKNLKVKRNSKLEKELDTLI